jgi:hypothetical protein
MKVKTDVLASGLDIMYADRIREVSKIDVMTYSESHEEGLIQNQLNQWSEKGLVEIIKPLAQCKDREPCIKLLGWIQPRP